MQNIGSCRRYKGFHRAQVLEPIDVYSSPHRACCILLAFLSSVALQSSLSRPHQSIHLPEMARHQTASEEEYTSRPQEHSADR